MESNSAFYLRVQFAIIHTDRNGLPVWMIDRFPASVDYPAPRAARRLACLSRAAMSLAGVRFSPSVFISFYRFLVRGAIGARARARSSLSDRCALARQLDPFSKIIVSAVSAGRKASAMTTRFLA